MSKQTLGRFGVHLKKKKRSATANPFALTQLFYGSAALVQPPETLDPAYFESYFSEFLAENQARDSRNDFWSDGLSAGRKSETQE
jgi:hypothetical protein